MSFPFTVTEHILDGQHIRQNPAATAHQHQPLKLVINHYQPKEYDPQDGDVTIIAAHGNGMFKELYEPLFEDLLKHCRVRIRGIWIADVASQGASAVLNEENLGNSPDYSDHSRDLLHMVNVFRNEMPEPIVGLGHSMGSISIILLSILHPSLFASLVLIETFASNRDIPDGAAMRRIIAVKRDLWPSRVEAETALRKAEAFQTLDGRVMERMLAQSFRNTPTLLHPVVNGSVTLRTPREQEVFMAYQSDIPQRLEAVRAAKLLPMLRPSVLLVQGSKSTVTTIADRQMRLSTIGTGFEGSGGSEAGMVEEVVIHGSHFLGLEAVEQTAKEIGRFLDIRISSWRNNRTVFMREWSAKSGRAKQSMESEWLKKVKAQGRSSSTKL